MKSHINCLFSLSARLATFVLAAFLSTAGPGTAGAKDKNTSPYFATLKADEVHVRKGPGRSYNIVWTYRSLGLPVEVTGSHEHWRRIRDSSGAEGWVYFRLISALRMALISPWQKAKQTFSLRKTANESSSVLARLEPGVKVLVKSCTGSWCLISVGGFKGWINQKKLWGVYPGEVIK